MSEQTSTAEPLKEGEGEAVTRGWLEVCVCVYVRLPFSVSVYV